MVDPRPNLGPDSPISEGTRPRFCRFRAALADARRDFHHGWPDLENIGLYSKTLRRRSGTLLEQHTMEVCQLTGGVGMTTNVNALGGLDQSVARSRPTLDRFRPNLAKFDQTRPALDQNWPPSSANFQ